ncbi:MAG: ABC transporter permease [Hydrococcus sp. C42_A2020_068]|uniref:FtsX-like permease family protein n=1 Tax=Pleurocapsa sp. PCC 7327 TaxID=118163 RepID=UPI0002A0008C|nr:FtsX-like permease family protein [Pleurocapsa sp. PCC 7327]AFY76527.1 ABC-type antimicrobial peptide transport system, permease component [Pleurocapsa sp. PCC 7327]MBF2022604.1 ABC transporter permease [Hydrococcus sp. C42_A2020_068]
MVSIARKNLLEDLPRFLVAQAGIMFAVSLVTIQTGILNGFSRSTALLIDRSKADIWLTSDRMVQFEYTEPLTYAQLEEAKQVEGVERAEPITLTTSRWYPANSTESSSVRIIGFDPNGRLFQPGDITQGSLKAVSNPYTIMVEGSRIEELHINSIGQMGKIGSLPARVDAVTENTQSLVASPFVFTSLKNVNTYMSAGYTSRVNCQANENGKFDCTTIYEKASDAETKQSQMPPLKALSLTDPVTYILIKAKPGQNMEALKKRLQETIPGTTAYTKAEMSQKTRDYWKVRTGVGVILGIGAAVGVIVGMVVVSQILYSSVSEHIKEFGTLKAIGASDKLLYGVIVEQSIWMAVLGYIPGMLICLGLSAAVAEQGIIILITPGAAVGVFGIIVAMCIGSAFLAIRKVTRIDPAMVFKG